MPQFMFIITFLVIFTIKYLAEGQMKRDELIINLRKQLDKIAIQNFKDMINSCAVSQSIDPAIVIIINEEMPAYFTGQKSFDDVVNLINNRVTTVLNEQG